MYILHLTRRYLFHRFMPLLSSLSVAISVAMVLVIWSIMGGFLTQFIGSSRTMLGDVLIEPGVGMAHYQDLLTELRSDPRIGSASATLESLGLLALPNGELRTVEVVGIDPESYDRVTGYTHSLVWHPDAGVGSIRLADRRIDVREAFEAGRTLRLPGDATLPGVVVGGAVAGGPGDDGAAALLPGQAVTLSVLPLDEQHAGIAGRTFMVANLLRTGRHDIDSARVLLPLDTLQTMLGYGAGVQRTPEGGERRIEPRVTSIMIDAAPGVRDDEVFDATCRAWERFESHHRGQTWPLARMLEDRRLSLWSNLPWQEVFIGEVRKQIALLLGLFSLVSLTASFLVFSVFWSMISEKIRDIGVLRSLGASRLGITGLYLLYGAGLGALGALLGLALSWLIVANINPIHDGLTRLLGFVLWDPDVYFFSRIPNRINLLHALVVMTGGVLLSLLGALLPAIRAARMDPARALQFE
ncbi:MAG: ABC transporter permease [Phycisphaerales bacterium]|nr:ABC transporter permease [Phycisphaerales bacterium]